MLWRYVAWIAAAAVGLLNAGEGWTQNYTFQKILDQSDGYTNFASRPAINNNGTIAFGAVRDGQQGIFIITSGGQVKPIALLGPAYAAFSKIGNVSQNGAIINVDVGNPDINDLDQVAFYATTGCDAGIFVGDGDTTTTIARTGSLGIDPPHLDTRLSLNNLGVVAFSTSGSTVLNGVHVGNGGFIATIDKNGVNPWINDQNVVAYAVKPSDPFKPGAILTNAGKRIAIVNESDVPNTFPSINDFGLVAFQGRAYDYGPLGILLGYGVDIGSFFTPSLLLVADGRLPATDPGINGQLAINDLGIVAFWSTYAGCGGIFATRPGRNPSHPRQVIVYGDTILDGCQVSLVDFSPHGLNDSGQIVFWAQYVKYVNGEPVRSRGIFVASPTGLSEE